MKNIFQQMLLRKPKKNVFDLSHEHKFSCNLGSLVPFYTQEILPGDIFSVNSELLARFQALLSPVMHRVDVFTHFFYVPNRIIWDEWEDFITGGDDGTLTPTVPTLTINQGNAGYFQKGNLPDYMGVPVVPQPIPTITNPYAISALPFRAYLKIWNEYYRDQNLQTEIDIETATTQQLTTLRLRAWEHDYFTSCLPDSQKGTEVQLPVTSNMSPVYKSQGTVVDSGGGSYPSSSEMNVASDSGDLVTATPDGEPINIENLAATQTATGSVLINELRTATRLQAFLERNMRGGTRHRELILAHFGERTKDSRMQVPEYLGGGKQPMVISEVLNNSAVREFDSNDIITPQASMSGHGISIGKSNSFKRKFVEHGHIIGIMSILPRSSYQDGINKKFLRTDKLDYYWPDFAQLGEQEVLSKELYADWTRGTSDDVTFGYQSRYAEYKHNPSIVSGEMRDTLDFWHFGRQFSSAPLLNEDFIEASVRLDPFAVNDGSVDTVIVQCFNNIKAIRPIPYFNVPTIR